MFFPLRFEKGFLKLLKSCDMQHKLTATFDEKNVFWRRNVGIDRKKNNI